MRFLNRADEVAMLGQRLAGRQAELLAVYGRRRVGKTELLAHVAADVRALHFEATDTVASDQLRDLTAELARVWGNELLAAQPLTSWDAALAAIAQFVGTQRTLVVLDEFQLLAAQSPELETVLSRWWRTTGRHLPIVLVLAGSELSFFEDNVLAGRLYGRRTGQLKLPPFLAHEAALFHPRYHPGDRVRAYSVCGGIPYYLERFTDDRPLADHLLTEVFERTGLLHEEAELMLRQSIADPTNHIAVLRSTLTATTGTTRSASVRTSPPRTSPSSSTPSNGSASLSSCAQSPRALARRRRRTRSATSSCASTTASSSRPSRSCTRTRWPPPTSTTPCCPSWTITPRSRGRTSAASTCYGTSPG